LIHVFFLEILASEEHDENDEKPGEGPPPITAKLAVMLTVLNSRWFVGPDLITPNLEV